MILIDGEFLSEAEMQEEAVKRMKKLHIDSEAIRLFQDEKKLRCSYENEITDVPDYIQDEIEKWEKEFKNLVYHVVYSDIYGYRIFNCLSVSCYKEDMHYENSIMMDNRVMAYCINLTIPEFTESGSIIVAVNNGVLLRLA
jgi:hypothetical protein